MELTSRERLLLALQCKQPDRVPIWMLYPRQQLPYYVDVHTLPSYKRVMPFVWNNTDWFDRRSISAPMFFTAAANTRAFTDVRGEWTITRQVLQTPLGELTSEHRIDQESAAGATTEYFCKDISDLEKVLSIPYESFEPDLKNFHRAAKTLGDEGVMMMNTTMPLGVAYNLFDPSDFAIYSLTEQETIIRFLKVIFDRIYMFMKKVLDAGAGPVFFTVDTEFVAPPLGSPAIFDALILPFQTPIIELIRSYQGLVISHHHGRINAVLEKIEKMGVNGIHPCEEPPIGDCALAEAKTRVGDQVCLIGSMQYDDFNHISPDEMEEFVKRQIRDAAEGGGFILAPTAGPYQANLTELQQENIVRFIEAGLRWGQYPLKV